MDLIEIGKIVGTHGIRGEVRAEPWCDTPAFLAGFQTVYLRGKPYAALSRVHKNMVLMKLEGIDTVEAAQALRGTVLFIDRTGVSLPEGRFFVKDIIGLSVVNNDGEHVGTIVDVLTTPAHDVYNVRGGDGEHMIPAVPEFVKDIDIESGIMRVALIEGM